MRAPPEFIPTATLLSRVGGRKHTKSQNKQPNAFTLGEKYIKLVLVMDPDVLQRQATRSVSLDVVRSAAVGLDCRCTLYMKSARVLEKRTSDKTWRFY